EREGIARGPYARRESGKADVVGRKPERPREYGAVRRRADLLGQFRQIEAGEPATGRWRDLAAHGPDGLLQHERAALGPAVPTGEQYGGADRGMASERQLAAGREDAQARGVARPRRRPPRTRRRQLGP